MSVKTLNSVHGFRTSTPANAARTFSIAPTVTASPSPRAELVPTPMDLFLEGENPLGCIRGVMWVMAFNAGCFAVGFLVWQLCKFIR